MYVIVKQNHTDVNITFINRTQIFISAVLKNRQNRGWRAHYQNNPNFTEEEENCVKSWFLHHIYKLSRWNNDMFIDKSAKLKDESPNISLTINLIHKICISIITQYFLIRFFVTSIFIYKCLLLHKRFSQCFKSELN